MQRPHQSQEDDFKRRYMPIVLSALAEYKLDMWHKRISNDDQPAVKEQVCNKLNKYVDDFDHKKSWKSSQGDIYSSRSCLNQLETSQLMKGSVKQNDFPLIGEKVPETTMRMSAKSQAGNEAQCQKNMVLHNTKLYDCNSNNLCVNLNKKTFSYKLYEMLEDPANNNAITWSDHGSSFKISNSKLLEGILRKYFRHSNVNSFLRLAYSWGFRKIGYGSSKGCFQSEVNIIAMQICCLVVFNLNIKQHFHRYDYSGFEGAVERI